MYRDVLIKLHIYPWKYVLFASRTDIQRPWLNQPNYDEVCVTSIRQNDNRLCCLAQKAVLHSRRCCCRCESFRPGGTGDTQLQPLMTVVSGQTVQLNALTTNQTPDHIAVRFQLSARLLCPRRHRAEALSDAFVWRLSLCLSVAYIEPNSRSERPTKTKIGTDVAHVTRDSDTPFKIRPAWLVVLAGQHGHAVMVTIHMRTWRISFVSPLAGLGGRGAYRAVSRTACYA